jgi:hypothetical protein
MSMKSPNKFQTKSTGSYATVRTSLWRRPDAPQCPTDNDEDVRTSEQHRPDASSIRIQHGVGFQKSTLLRSLCKPSEGRGNTSGRCLAFQNIPVFRSNPTRSYNEDLLEARSSRPDVDLIKIELRCLWKNIAKNGHDMAKLLSRRSIARVRFLADLGFL